MEFQRLYNLLNEKKYRQPITVYHGSATVNLREILKKGIEPNPKNKVWDSDDSASASQVSRASLDGSYWTSNLMTAYSSAGRANRKIANEYGAGIIVIGKIAENSAVADEDNTELDLDWAISATLVKQYKANNYGYHYLLADAMKDSVPDFFYEDAHERLGNSKGELPKDLLTNVLLSNLLRRASYDDSVADKLAQYDLKIDISPEDAEASYKKWQDKLTRRYTKSAYKDDGAFSHTLRMRLPVNFKGSNRITGIVEFRKDDDDDRELVIHYGEIPEDFKSQWRERMGDWPNVIDKTHS